MDKPKQTQERADLAKKGVDIDKLEPIILQLFPYLASTLKDTKIVAGAHGEVANASGSGIELNTGKLAGKSKMEQAATLAHELLHIKKGETSTTLLENIAADAVNNAELKAGGLPPKNGVDIPNAMRYGKERLVIILTKLHRHITAEAKQRSTQQGPQFLNFTEMDFQKAIFGDHAMWERAILYLQHKEAQAARAVQKPPVKQPERSL